MSEPTATGLPSDLAMIRLLMDRMGITAEDLHEVIDAGPRTPVPTFADYIDRVADAVSPGTRKVYGSYWNRVRAVWGQRRLDEPTALEIAQLAEAVRAQAVVRRNSRGGRSAAGGRRHKARIRIAPQ